MALLTTEVLTKSSAVAEGCDVNQQLGCHELIKDDNEKPDIVCHYPVSRNDHAHRHLHHYNNHRYHCQMTATGEQLQGLVGHHQQQQKQFCEFVIQSKLSPKSIRTVVIPRLVDLRTAVVAALPYLAFLTSFALNAHLRILPTADDSQNVTLYNVSLWESYILPCSLNTIVASVHHPLLDILAALPYLAHYVLPLAYPAYLYLSDRSELVPQFFRLLGWSMWVHYAIWFCLPTFPPWSVVDSTAGGGRENSTAALNLSAKEGRAFSRVDQLLRWPLFHNLFSGNPVPFASFPSGHVAWPTCIFLTLPPGGSMVFGSYIALMSWATMYSDHHYVLDAIVAILVVSSTQKVIGCVTRSSPAPNELIA